MVGEFHLHVNGLDRPNLDRSPYFENWAAFRKLRRLLQIARLNKCEAADHIFGLREGAIGHAPLLAYRYLAGVFERLVDCSQITLGALVVEPRDPLRHFVPNEI